MKKLPKSRPWHSHSPKEVFGFLGSSPNGLSEKESRSRIENFGKNELPSSRNFSGLKTLFSQFSSPLVLLVLLAATFSFFIGHIADTIFILFVVFINIIVGFFQENKAERALEKLKKSVQHFCIVKREGNKKQILAQEVVIGDVVLLETGDKIPADGRIFESNNFSVNESMLTGESEPIEKNSKTLDKRKRVNGQTNMVFLGSIVEKGSARFIVCATGINTQLGKISQLVKQQKQTKTPLQKKIQRLSKLLGIFIVVSISCFAFLGISRGESVGDVFITSIALVVSAVPEGILPAITVILIFGMRRLAKKRALVRKLDANEAMGAITTICFDKTGTLTKGEMQVDTVLTGKKELLEQNGDFDNFSSGNPLESHIKTLEICALVNDAFIENPGHHFSKWIVRGRPTDKALLLAGANAGIHKLEIEKRLRLLYKIPFGSENKFAANFYQNGDKVDIYFIGAPEKAIERSSRLDLDGHSIPIGSTRTAELLNKMEQLAENGLRVLACARKTISLKKFSNLKNKLQLLEEMHLVGFVGLKDPLRIDVKNSIRIATRAGIRPLVITGDHKRTTQAILKQLQMEVPENQIVEGKDLEKMSKMKLRTIVNDISIFARVLPKDKIRIVQALQANNQVVAMVGDGINDAPAIKAADVGIALGNASDISKEVADIILLNNSFSSIIKAIEQGRLIFENIRRVILYLIADDFSELFLFFSVAFLGLPFPLYPVQILWINLVEDGFPDIALTTEKDTEGLMREKPRNPKEPILSSDYKKFMTAVFFVSGLSALLMFLFFLYFSGDIEKARTTTFVLIGLDSLTFAYIVKSLKHSVLTTKTFSNNILNLSISFSLILLVAGIYFDPFQSFLRVVPLKIFDWISIIFVTLLELLILEIFKNVLLVRKKSPTILK